MPGLSDKAKTARAFFDPDYAASIGSGQQTQQPRQLQIPAGAQIGRDAKGNVVG